MADIDRASGRNVLRGAVLAAEQLNAEGGILGRNVTIVSEDNDAGTAPYDISSSVNALIKLITVDKADYVISGPAGTIDVLLPYQDICFEQKKIQFSVGTVADNLTQRVIDNYERYKYYFRHGSNATTTSDGMLGDILAVGKHTGFTRVALLFDSTTAMAKSITTNLKNTLPENGFEVVYSNFYLPTTKDWGSYFAAIEESGAQILFPFILSQPLSMSLIAEWYNRRSPVVVWGRLAGSEEPDFWNLTEGKCDTVSFVSSPVISGYPFTNKTMPMREAYIQRWGEIPGSGSFGAYDILRTILPDAIKRAGTYETETVIKALEATDLETSTARHFKFTTSHDTYYGGTINDPSSDYSIVIFFQWQNATQVPVKPESLMKEAGATYKYPPWQGPWSNK